jgi:two-component system cell cycle response regulator CpdR
LQGDETSTKGDQGRQILVVDDEPAICGAIKMMLEYDGHAIQTASNGKEAMSLLEQRTFDVVITDYSMPEMRGDALAAAIKQRLPNQPVVMITAHADLLKASGNPLTGVDFLISKPFSLEDLRTAIARVLPGMENVTTDEFKSGHRHSGGNL